MWDHSQLRAAEEALREAVRLGGDLAPDTHVTAEYRLNLAQSHELLANVMTSLGRPRDALAEYHHAMLIQARLVEEFPAAPLYRLGLASIHHNIGVCYYHAAQWGPSEAEYRTALNLRHKLVEEFPGEFTYRQRQGEEYLSLGILLAHLGRQGAAVDAYETALQIQEKLVREFPALPSLRQDLARTCNNFSMMDLDPARQERLAERALDLKERLVADFPQVPEFRDDLARSLYNRAGRLSKHHRWEEAEATLRRVREIQAKLVADYPDVLQYAMYQGIGFYYSGVLEADRGKPEAALAWFDRAAAALERVRAREPSQSAARFVLFETYVRRAGALHDLDRHPESLQALDFALTSPETPTDVLRQGACVCGVAVGTKTSAGFAEQYAGRALRLLTRAKAQGGFRDPTHLTWLKEEKCLEPLRQRDDFRKFLEGVEQRP
jgi:tetratricopeptide (TPR) repeat protein